MSAGPPVPPESRVRRVRALRAAPLMIAALLVASAASATTVTIDPTTFTTRSDFWDRWNYPFNGTPGQRNLAPTFGAFPDPGMSPEFDQKDGQMAVVFDTATAGIQTGEDPTSYVVNSLTITVTHFQGTFAFDPTYDVWQTYLEPSDPDYIADSDTGRPLELYGLGLRNGFTALSLGAASPGIPDYEEFEPFGAMPEGQAIRNAFPLDFGVPDPEGDVSSNVYPLGLATGFDPVPWAVGQATVTAAGSNVIEGVPGFSAGETFSFSVDVSDPDIFAYVQQGLSDGLVGFSIVSMHPTAQQAGGTNPNFYTSDNFDPAAVPPTLTIDFTVAQPIPTLPVAAHALLGLFVALLGARLLQQLELAHVGPR